MGVRGILPAACALGVLSACTTELAGVREISAESTELLSAFETSGETSSCVSLRRLRSIDVLEDQLLLFEIAGGQKFLNQPADSCGMPRPGQYIQYVNHTGQLCKGDLVRLTHHTTDMVVGSCILGEFEKLEPVAMDTLSDDLSLQTPE